MAHSVYFCNYSIGPECYKNIEEICKPFGKRIFLIYGEHAYAAAGALLEDAIADTDLSIVDRQIFGEDCTMNGIEHLAAIAKKVNADMIFGLGGGKAIDTAKGAADTVGLPVFAFPTIASTCAATTKLSVVYREDHSFEKFLYYDRPARHCFINTQVIADAPDRYLRAGMGDTIGNILNASLPQEMMIWSTAAPWVMKSADSAGTLCSNMDARRSMIARMVRQQTLWKKRFLQ